MDTERGEQMEGRGKCQTVDITCWPIIFQEISNESKSVSFSSAIRNRHGNHVWQDMILYSLLKDSLWHLTTWTVSVNLCISMWPKFTFVHAKQVVAHIHSFTLSPWFHKNNFQMDKKVQVQVSSGQGKKRKINRDRDNVQQCIDLIWMIMVSQEKRFLW